jgi:hypothetical protein
MYVDLLFCMFLIWIPNVLELNRLVYFELAFMHFVCEYWFELIACKSGGFIFFFSWLSNTYLILQIFSGKRMCFHAYHAIQLCRIHFFLKKQKVINHPYFIWPSIFLISCWKINNEVLFSIQKFVDFCLSFWCTYWIEFSLQLFACFIFNKVLLIYIFYYDLPFCHPHFIFICTNVL